jgi:flagellar basal body-associated protein FliL
MSEIEEQEPFGSEDQSSKSGKGIPAAKWLTIVAVVLVVALAAFIIAQRVIVPKLTGDHAVGEKLRDIKQNLIEAEEEEEKEPVEKDGPVSAAELKAITVNTAASRGRRFVTFDLSLESRVTDVEERVNLKEYQIRDALIGYFGGRTVTELSSRPFLSMAKDTVATIINDILRADVVDTVYFTKFLVQ